MFNRGIKIDGFFEAVGFGDGQGRLRFFSASLGEQPEDFGSKTLGEGSAREPQKITDKDHTQTGQYLGDTRVRVE